MVPAIESAGFVALATSEAREEVREQTPLLVPDLERQDRDLRERFARRGARVRAATLLHMGGEWQPDVIVCDEVDFGAMIAAERLGIPYASVTVIAAGSFVRKELVAAPLHELRGEHGLPPDPELKMLSRHLVLSPVPPSFRDPASPLPDTGHSIRPCSRPLGRRRSCHGGCTSCGTRRPFISPSGPCSTPNPVTSSHACCPA
jgi:hypothetical protein